MKASAKAGREAASAKPRPPAPGPRPPRKVCVVLVDRANYGRLKPVMQAIAARPELKLQSIAAGTMVLERFGKPVDVVKHDGLPVDGEIYTELEGGTPSSMAKSVGVAVAGFASEFQRLRPDLVLLIGDRYEALAAAVAAAYMNLCIVHVQGGEVSGSIDESARHAISKLAQFHFPSTLRSRDYLVRMGESPHTILGTGCPSSDIARKLDRRLDPQVVNAAGSGAPIDLERPFLLVIYHPVTTAFGGEQRQIRELLAALDALKMQTILLWPNIDAGADHISKAIRIFRDQHAPVWLRTLTNLPPEDYLRVLAAAHCAVGNSSSFVRDAGYFGTPVVLVGDRQEGRETGLHVTPALPYARRLVPAIRRQLRHGRYAPCSLYGDGYTAARIAAALVELEPYVQKRLHYIYEDRAAKPQRVNGHARSWNRDGEGRLEGDPPEEHRNAAR